MLASLATIMKEKTALVTSMVYFALTKKVHDYINSLITSGIYIIHDKIQLFINIDYVMFNRMFLILPLFFISIYFIQINKRQNLL